MDVQTVQHKHPRGLGVSSHRLLDVSGEVFFGARRTDGFGKRDSLYNVPVPDQRGRAVAGVLELLTGDFAGGEVLIGSAPFEGLYTG